MYTVTKELEFCCAHRLVGHKGGCRRVHGHNYIVKITLRSSHLDQLGMVKDFKEVKVIQKWLDDNWDHKLLFFDEDPLLESLLNAKLSEEATSILAESIVVVEWNPTAENMSKALFELAVKEFGRQFVEYVEVYETSTSKALYDGVLT